MTLNDAIDSQLESPFFSKLPLELRGSIYRFAFDVEDVSYIELPFFYRFRSPLNCTHSTLAWDRFVTWLNLRISCKRLNLEIDNALFETITYGTRISWLAQYVPESIASRIRNLEISYVRGKYVNDDPLYLPALGYRKDEYSASPRSLLGQVERVFEKLNGGSNLKRLCIECIREGNREDRGRIQGDELLEEHLRKFMRFKVNGDVKLKGWEVVGQGRYFLKGVDVGVVEEVRSAIMADST